MGYLETEEAVLQDMCGLSQEEFIQATFEGSLASYKTFCSDRRGLRSQGRVIHPVILGDSDWRLMRELDISVKAWLRLKYQDKRQGIQGILDGEKLEKQFKEWDRLNRRT